MIPTLILASLALSGSGSRAFLSQGAQTYPYTIGYKPAVVDYAHIGEFKFESEAAGAVVPMPTTNDLHIVGDYRLLLDGKEVDYRVVRTQKGQPWALFQIPGLRQGKVEWRVHLLHYGTHLASKSPGPLPAGKWIPSPPAPAELEPYKHNPVAAQHESLIRKFVQANGLDRREALIPLLDKLLGIFRAQFQYKAGVVYPDIVLREKQFDCNGGSFLTAGVLNANGIAAKTQYGLNMHSGVGHQIIVASVGGPWVPWNVVAFNDEVPDPFRSDRQLAVQSFARDRLQLSAADTPWLVNGGSNTVSITPLVVHSTWFFDKSGKSLGRVQGRKASYAERTPSAEDLTRFADLRDRGLFR